jgi:hypothetical protein
MHKTFTDCYLANGFTDGGWGYALNGYDAKARILAKEHSRLKRKKED